MSGFVLSASCSPWPASRVTGSGVSTVPAVFWFMWRNYGFNKSDQLFIEIIMSWVFPSWKNGVQSIFFFYREIRKSNCSSQNEQFHYQCLVCRWSSDCSDCPGCWLTEDERWEGGKTCLCRSPRPRAAACFPWADEERVANLNSSWRLDLAGWLWKLAIAWRELSNGLTLVSTRVLLAVTKLLWNRTWPKHSLSRPGCCQMYSAC